MNKAKWFAVRKTSTCEIIATSANQIVLPKFRRPTKMLYYIHQTPLSFCSVEGRSGDETRHVPDSTIAKYKEAQVTVSTSNLKPWRRGGLGAWVLNTSVHISKCLLKTRQVHSFSQLHSASTIVHSFSQLHSASTIVHSFSQLHSASTIVHSFSQLHSASTIVHTFSQLHSASTIVHSFSQLHSASTIVHSFSQLHSASTIFHSFSQLHSASTIVHSFSQLHSASTIVHSFSQLHSATVSHIVPLLQGIDIVKVHMIQLCYHDNRSWTKSPPH